jgi:radical SAM superfamily enzyme YgiQ (UPF0313 family)
MGPKLLLINPALFTNGKRAPNVGGIVHYSPLALAYVAALTPEHWEIRIVDEVEEEIPEDYAPDLVALTSGTVTVPRAYEIARHYREQGLPVVMGGIHATVLPDEAAQYVDVVFQGDSEGGWPSLIRDFETGKLKSRYDGRAAVLEGLPVPRRDLFQYRYFLQLVSASRGCRYRCEFCSLWQTAGGRHRMRPPEEVLDELEAIWDERPILFTDDNIYTDREWALTLFKGIVARGFRRPFAVQASIDIVDDEEMLTTLKRGGCLTVCIGFESVSEESLSSMRKGVNLRIGVEHYKEKVAILHDHGLVASGTFILGGDGDDPDIFKRTAELVLDAKIDVTHFGLLTPNPGTILWDRLEREGRLLYTNFPDEYVHFDLRTVTFRPRKMTVQQLEEGMQWMAQTFGSRRMTARRAWNTFRVIKDLNLASVAFRWHRSGFVHRIVG